MSKKKSTPIAILKSLEPFLKKSGENFISIESKEDLIRFSDFDEDSDFYFHIKQYALKSNKYQVYIVYKPFTEQSVDKREMWVESNKIDSYFQSWVNLLKMYDTVQSPFDDPIIESFKEDYYTEFEIIHEDVNKPLKPKQILLIDSYFEKVEERIEKHITDSNANEIAEIKSDITELRENLSVKAKSWVINKVCWIWAKMTKLGPKLMKDFVDEGNKQIVKEGVKQLIEIGKSAIM